MESKKKPDIPKETIKNYEIGKNLKYLREHNNLTVSELAKILKISRQHLYTIENNGQNPSLQLIEKICDFFGIRIITFIEMTAWSELDEDEDMGEFDLYSFRD